MRKGDERKREILSVAERLFCAKGYEETSIQEIVQLCGTSKGGFYHHFVSKDAVLEALCVQRAQEAAMRTESRLAQRTGDLERINLTLSGCIPFSEEDSAFLAMVMPTLRKPEGRSLRSAYQEAILAQFTPILDRELALAAQNGAILPCSDNLTDVILQLVNTCWIDLIGCLREESAGRAGAILEVLRKYRRCIELLLNAPYGSILLSDLRTLDGIAAGLQTGASV